MAVKNNQQPEQNNGLAHQLEAWMKIAIESDKRIAKYKHALTQIQAMKLNEGETDYKYAFNRCWHIATDALK